MRNPLMRKIRVQHEVSDLTEKPSELVVDGNIKNRKR